MNTNHLKLALPVASLLLAAAACGTAQPTDVTPQTATSTAARYTESSLPPQPTLLVGKYPDPQAMAAKIQAAGVPLVLDKELPYMNDDHTDVYGMRYAYGDVGAQRVSLYTFDWEKNADKAEANTRSQGIQTYRGDGWYIGTKTPALLNQLAEILNK